MPRCYICDASDENLPSTYLTEIEKGVTILYTEDNRPMCQQCAEAINRAVYEEELDDAYGSSETSLPEPSVDTED